MNMFSKEPQNTEKYYWTEHAKFKMKFYGLSAQRVLGVINNPKRKEEGIVPKTIAVMKPVNPKKEKGKEVWKQEIWVMYQTRVTHNVKRETKEENKSLPGFTSRASRYAIISAWRYPGVSPKRNPIPQDILEEISGHLEDY